MLLVALALSACTPDPAAPESTGIDPTAGWTADADADTDVDTDADTDEGAVELGLDPACSPFNTGGDCATPWPSIFHMAADPGSETGLRLDYAREMLTSPDGPLPVDPGMFNRYDGISTTSPLLLHLGRDVHPDHLAGLGAEAASLDSDSLVLLDVETGERVPLMIEMDRNNRDTAAYEGRHALILRPVAPMTPGGRYVAAATSRLTDVDGAPFDASPGFAALRDDVLTTDNRIEAQRARYEDTLFPALDAAGFARSELLVAWEVQIASETQSLGPILSMKDAAAAAMAADGVPHTTTLVSPDHDEDVALLVEGTFQPPSFLDDNELRYADDAYSVLLSDAEPPAYEFTMIVPKGLPETGSVPLVVMGHGIFGEGRGYLTSSGTGQLVQQMAAAAGVVIVATDWVGLSGGDLDLIISEVIPDLGRVRVVTDRLAQSLINNQALVHLVRTELQFIEETGRDAADPLLDDRLYYYGVSLGGIQGTSFAGLTDDVSRAIVSVPGGGWTHMIQRSVHFEQIEVLLDALYPDPLSQVLFITALQSDFDASDPVNLGRRLREREDFVGVVQEAVGDCQVPNVATDVLVRVLEADHLEAAPRPIHGVDTISGPVSQGLVVTQMVLPDALADFMPPDENTIPERNNNTHSDAVRTDAALAQVLQLVATGEVGHPCEGDCDPD